LENIYDIEEDRKIDEKC